MMDSNSIKSQLINSLNSTTILNNKLNSKIMCKINFVCNPFVELIGNSEDEYKVEFIDGDNIVHTSHLKVNMWSKANRSYFTNWRIKITNLNSGIIEHDQQMILEDKRVLISFESKSIGDTLAWFPYVEEFRKKHKCQLIVSTFLNELFIEKYPEIEFVKPGTTVDNIFAQWRLGWFYKGISFDSNLHPTDFKNGPLQKTASDILGLEYKEILPKLDINLQPKQKRVGIGFHSTAQAKYWNNPDGWQKVIDFLVSNGYECVVYSKEEDGYMGNRYPKGITQYQGGDIKQVAEHLTSCEFFIGLGSGLSWLAWACGLPIVLVSGFSKKWAETTTNTYRVINQSVCNGCFNTMRLDPGDWNWCPMHKGSSRQFECTKKISADSVIKEITRIINGEPPVDEIQSEVEISDKITGWFSYNKIYDLFVDEAQDNSTIVEIGSWFGKSTKYLIDKVKSSGKQINIEVIDTFKGSQNEEKPLKIVGEYGNDIYQSFYENIDLEPNITVHKNYSNDSADLFPMSSIDFLLIDGDHSYDGVISDIEHYFYKVKPGGLLAGDDYNVYKDTTRAVDEYFLGSHMIYGNNYNWLWRKPKIQVVHISTLPTQDRAKKSLKNIELLKKYGFDIKLIQNSPYTGEVDLAKYANPISKTVKPSHYGCYLAHVQVLKEIDRENYDFTLVFEEDAFIYSTVKEFLDVLYKAVFCCQKDKNIAYVSFGALDGYKSGQLVERKEFNYLFDECWSQILTHCYLIPNYHQDWFIEKIQNSPWDSSDLWYNLIFEGGERKRLVTKKFYSKQINGVSIIDEIHKDYSN